MGGNVGEGIVIPMRLLGVVALVDVLVDGGGYGSLLT